jgi:hypothetical protein
MPENDAILLEGGLAAKVDDFDTKAVPSLHFVGRGRDVGPRSDHIEITLVLRGVGHDQSPVAS